MGSGNERQSARLPGPCIALRRGATRRAAWGRQDKGNPHNREREKNAYTRTCARILSPRSFFSFAPPLSGGGLDLSSSNRGCARSGSAFLLGQSQSALRAGLMAPAWHPALCISDFGLGDLGKIVQHFFLQNSVKCPLEMSAKDGLARRLSPCYGLPLENIASPVGGGGVPCARNEAASAGTT